LQVAAMMAASHKSSQIWVTATVAKAGFCAPTNLVYRRKQVQTAITQADRICLRAIFSLSQLRKYSYRPSIAFRSGQL